MEQESGLAASVCGNDMRGILARTAALFDAATTLRAQNPTTLYQVRPRRLVLLNPHWQAASVDGVTGTAGIVVTSTFLSTLPPASSVTLVSIFA